MLSRAVKGQGLLTEGQGALEWSPYTQHIGKKLECRAGDRNEHTHTLRPQGPHSDT